MFPSTFRYLGTRSVKNSLSQEKIKIDLRKLMFPSAFRYLGTRSVKNSLSQEKIKIDLRKLMFLLGTIWDDDVPLVDKTTNDLKEEIGIWDDQVTRPLIIALRVDGLLSSLVKLKEYPEDMARSLSDDIDNLEISVKESTLSYAFKCYCLSNRLRIDFGLSILGRLFKKYCVPNELISRILTSDKDMLGIFKENRSCETKELFKKIVREKTCGIDIDAVTYGTLIDGLCKDGHSMIAVEVLRIMEKKGHPRLDARTLNMIVEGWIKESKIYDKLENFYKDLRNGMGLCKEKKVYSALESFYEMLWSDMRFGCIHDELIRGLCDMRLDSNIYRNVWTEGVEGEALKKVLRQMMERDCLRGQFRKAREVFRFMHRNNVIPKADCYNMLINGYCHCTKKKKIVHVMNLYREMRRKGFKPEEYIYDSILLQLLSIGRCSDALQIFDEMRVDGLKPNCFTFSNMLHRLCQNRQVEQALSLLNTLELEGVPLHIEYYNIVVEGFRKDGQFERAKDLLLKMKQLKFVPTRTLE